MGGDQQTLKFTSPSTQYVFSWKSLALCPQALWLHAGCFLWWGISVWSPVSQKPSLGLLPHWQNLRIWFGTLVYLLDGYLQPSTDAMSMLVGARVLWCSDSGEMVKMPVHSLWFLIFYLQICNWFFGSFPHITINSWYIIFVLAWSSW